MNREDAAHILYLLREAEKSGKPRTVYFNNSTKTKDDVQAYIRKTNLVKSDTELLQYLDLDGRSPYITWQDESEVTDELKSDPLPEFDSPPGFVSLPKFDPFELISKLESSEELKTNEKSVFDWVAQTKSFPRNWPADLDDSLGKSWDSGYFTNPDLGPRELSTAWGRSFQHCPVLPTLGFPLKRVCDNSKCQSDAGGESFTSSPSWSEDDLSANRQRLVTVVSLVLVRAFLSSQGTDALVSRPSGGGSRGSAKQDGPPFAGAIGRDRNSLRAGKRPWANDGDDDGDEVHKRRAGSGLAGPEASFSRLLACPFNKYDCRMFGSGSVDSRYHACTTWASVKIAHLKQHLKLHHCLPRYYCFRCCQEFKLQHEYAAHQRAEPQCTSLDLPRYRERIGADLREYFELDKKNPVGTSPVAYWNKIYNTCFADAANWRMVSPYYEGPAAESVGQFLHFSTQHMAAIFPLVRDRLGLDEQLSSEDELRLHQEAHQEAVARFLSESHEASPLQLGIPPRRPATRSAPTSSFNTSSATTSGLRAPSLPPASTHAEDLLFEWPSNSQAPGRTDPRMAQPPPSSFESMTEASRGSSSPARPATPHLNAKPSSSRSVHHREPRQLDIMSPRRGLYEPASLHTARPATSNSVTFASVAIDEYDFMTDLMSPGHDEVSNWDEHMEEALKIAWMYEDSRDHEGDIGPPKGPVFLEEPSFGPNKGLPQ